MVKIHELEGVGSIVSRISSKNDSFNHGSAFKSTPRNAGLPNNASQCPNFQFSVIGNWNSDRGFNRALLHNHVAPSLTHEEESMRFQDFADIAA